jgi:PAS domain S-box-containing protein
MKFYLNKKFFLGFVVSILILAVLGVSSFIYIRKVLDLSRQGAKEQRVLFLSERIRSLVTERERDIRDFRAGDDMSAIKSYSRLSATIGVVVEDLVSSTRDDSAQWHHVDKLRHEIANSNGMATMNTEERLSWIASHPDSIKFLIDRIQSFENLVRLERQAFATELFYQFVFTFFGLVLLGLTVPIALAFALNKNLEQRTRAEEKLSRASQTIHDLYEHAPCGYFSLNNDGVFTHANKTLLDLLGYSKEEIVDRTRLVDIISTDERKNYDDVFAMLRQDVQVHDVQFQIFTKNKTILPVSINATPILDQRNIFVSSRCTLFDITELKRAEAETRKVNLELEAFSYSVSHDLRAPLRSINGFAKILREDFGTIVDDEGNRLMGKIISNANRMGQLIDDLLAFSQLGKKEINKGEVNLDEFVKGIVNDLVDQEKTRRIRVNAGPLGKCFADQSMLQQVWVNLISNALKYSRKKEETIIEIGVTDTDGQKTFFVKDNGVGFDMQFSNKIFGVFQRLHKVEDFDGTGVGLALVKRIIERHHGRIWFDAKVNEGATFFFTLPSNKTKPLAYAVDH